MVKIWTYMNSPFLFTQFSEPLQWKLCRHSPEEPNCLKPSSTPAMSSSATSLISSTDPTWLASRPVAPSSASWFANLAELLALEFSLKVSNGWIRKLRDPLCVLEGLLAGLRPKRAPTTRPKNLRWRKS